MKIFLDDVRMPRDCISYMHNKIGALNRLYLEEWVIVRNYEEFIAAIEKHIESITHVSFDHDLSSEEDWKTIEKFEDYSVSTKGRIRRDRISRGTAGGIMKLSHNPDNGTIMVNLCKNGKHYPKAVHRLVAGAFIPNPLNKPQVNHKNGNRSDNRVENLEWCTNAENVQHSYDNLTRFFTSYGSNHANSKTVTQYNLMNIEINTYGSVNEAGRQLKIKFNNIAKCARGERLTAGGFIWKYEDKEPTISEIIKKLPKKRYIYQPFQEKTGFHCATWMRDYYKSKNKKLPVMFCHSLNPVGLKNIIGVFT